MAWSDVAKPKDENYWANIPKGDFQEEPGHDFSRTGGQGPAPTAQQLALQGILGINKVSGMAGMAGLNLGGSTIGQLDSLNFPQTAPPAPGAADYGPTVQAAEEQQAANDLAGSGYQPVPLSPTVTTQMTPAALFGLSADFLGGLASGTAQTVMRPFASLFGDKDFSNNAPRNAFEKFLFGNSPIGTPAQELGASGGGFIQAPQTLYDSAAKALGLPALNTNLLSGEPVGPANGLPGLAGNLLQTALLGLPLKGILKGSVEKSLAKLGLEAPKGVEVPPEAVPEPPILKPGELQAAKEALPATEASQAPALDTATTQHEALTQSLAPLGLEAPKPLELAPKAEPVLQAAATETPPAALPLRTEAPTAQGATTEVPPAELKPVPKPEPLTPIGTGETKTSKLAQGVEAKAVEQNLTKSLGDLPEFKSVKMKDQAKAAVDLLAKDEPHAIQIALGHAVPPAHLLPESVFIAVENRALSEGNVTLLRQLATSSRTTEATAMGQRISALAQRNPDSAVAGIKRVLDVRAAAAEKRLRTPVEKAVEETAGKIGATIKRPTRQDWNAFIEELRC